MKRNFIIAAAQAVLSMTTAIERRENTCICEVPADGQAKFSYRIFGTCRRIYVCGAGYGKSFLLQVACRPKIKNYHVPKKIGLVSSCRKGMADTKTLGWRKHERQLY